MVQTLADLDLVLSSWVVALTADYPKYFFSCIQHFNWPFDSLISSEIALSCLSTLPFLTEEV